MFVVLFEVEPRAKQWDDYLATARLLRPELEAIDGFVDNERFRKDPDVHRILSLSSWRDEKALVRWRTQATHHTVGQQRGRSDIFNDYRLRVGEVTADTDPPPGGPLREMRFDLTVVGAGKFVTIHEVHGGPIPLEPPTAPPADCLEEASYVALHDPHRRLSLRAWPDAASAAAGACIPDACIPGATRVRCVRIIREYEMRDRREAPQYFPAVT